MSELVTDKLFDLNNIYEYKLSIQVSLDGFSFFIVTTENKLAAFKHSPLKISSENFIARRFEEWLQTEQLLLKNYRQVEVIFFTNKFTLIPKKYFNPEKIPIVFQQLFGNTVDDRILENPVGQSDYYLCFAIPKLLYNIIQQKFANCKVLHPVNILSKVISGLNFEKYSLILLFNENSYYFLLSEGNKMLLANSYTFVHLNDVVYYLLSTLKELEIPMQKTRLFLSGLTKQYDETEANLSVYFKDIVHLKPESAVNFNSDIFTFDIHRFVTLLA